MSNEIKFSDLGLSPEMMERLNNKGFENATPIQAQAIPFLLTQNQDLIGKAQTGTGKTAAFGIPIIEQLKPNSKKVQAIILAPTRELAMQVSEELNSFYLLKNRIIAVYGGQPIEKQIMQLKKGVDIVVGTPGRIIDHIERKTIDLSQISHLVLDEADEMLNMGFVEDIETILKSAPANRKTILFSATMPSHIENLAKKYMKNYQIISVINRSDSGKTNIEQSLLVVDNSDKFEALFRIIENEDKFYGMVFCRTKMDADDISSKLIARSLSSEALHGNVSQSQREKILQKFRNKKINILVATDVAARGIDVDNLTHVVNYSLPQDTESYVHRIGRTGRAGKKGIAITIITPSEHRKAMEIQRVTNNKLNSYELPTVDNIVSSKKQKIKSNIIESVASIDPSTLELAREVMTDCGEDNEQIIAALLKMAFRNQLDKSKFRELRQVSIRPRDNNSSFGGSSYKSSNYGGGRNSSFGNRSSRFNEGSSRDRGYSRFNEGSSRDKGSSRSFNSSQASYSNDSNYNDDGSIRLFIAKGKNDNFDELSLTSFIKKETGVDYKNINNIKILDQFSFFAAEAKEAKKILDIFQQKSQNGKSLITRAKERK
ncbi:MAG: DEAD/DEAH box helicase [Rickettsiales bacterium]|nr:DEAD/DEAH box helicase [Rickettsiales bacterium]